MFEMKIRFASPEQIKSFCLTCQKMESDIDVVNVKNHYERIDGKSIIGLMTLDMDVPLLLQVSGDDEDTASERFSVYALTGESAD